MFAVLFKLGWFFKQYRYRYLTAVLLLVAVGLLEILPPKIIGDAVDAIRDGRMGEREFWQFQIFFLGIVLIVYGITYVWMYQLFGGSFLVERILRSQFMRHLLKMTPTFYEKNRTGDLMAKATNDLKAISQTAGFGILTLIDSTGFMLLILLTMGFMISWPLTLAALIPLPLIGLTISYFGKRIHQRFTEAQDAFGRMNDHVLESVSGVRVLRAYVKESDDEAGFNRMTEEVFQKNRAVAKIDALFEPIVRILVGSSYMIGLGYGAYFVFQNKLTLGELVSFNIYLGMLIWPMFAMGELVNIMQRGNASLDRVNQTLSYPPDVDDQPHPLHPPRPEHIVFDNFSFQYPTVSDSKQLQQIDLDIVRGQTIGIAGKTGSGKSTLIRQLLREYPAAGSIRINDVPIAQIALSTLHSWIGYVPQESFLFSRSLKDNIRFGSGEVPDEVYEAAIRSAALDEDLQRLPEGDATMVGERGVSLSGGQKQRIAIARALIIDPEILLMDDCLSAVDARTEQRIITEIRAVRADKTTLISSHRLSAIAHADQIIVLDQGRIAERGTHRELMLQGGWYHDQYVQQQFVTAIEEGE